MDIHEDAKNNAVTVSFELPGLKKEDVAIELQNNRLTISGETKRESERKEEETVIRER
jgi:HSP20 family protein